MKIALVSGSAGDTHCGVGDYVYELAQHLALDAQVTLYHDKNHGPQQPPFDKLVTLRLMPVGGYSLLGVKGLARGIAEQGFDIVHVQYPSKGYGNSVGPGFLPQNLSGIHSRSRLVATFHEWTASHPMRRMVMDQMLPSIDAAIVSNEADMHALSAKLGEKPVMMIPVGDVLTSRRELADIWTVAAGQQPEGLPAPSGIKRREPFSIFHYGLPETKGKGLFMLLEAMAMVRRAGIAAVLNLGGAYGPGQKVTEELLAKITELELGDAVRRLGHIPTGHLESQAEQNCCAVFPFDEGFSYKRSSLASISHCDLPLVVGAGGGIEHPYYAPEKNTAASLSVLLIDLLTGRLESEWTAQVEKQREFGRAFSFSGIAKSHFELYERLRKLDI